MLSRLRKQEGDQGFTLIELLVVIIIIGILAAIAIPVFLNQRKKGWDAAVKADLRNAVTSEETYLTSNNKYSAQSPVGTELTTVGFKYSAASNYDLTTGQVIYASTTGGSSYCLSAKSASGNWFSFGSKSGLSDAGTTQNGVDDGSGTCTAGAPAALAATP